jgi:hypothetical protein
MSGDAAAPTSILLTAAVAAASSRAASMSLQVQSYDLLNAPKPCAG